MDVQEKHEKKEFISQYINLAGGRFTDWEIDQLYELASNYSSYIGERVTKNLGRHKEYDSEDTYWVTESISFEYIEHEGYLCILETRMVEYDDGTVNEYSTYHNTARKILRTISKL